MIKHACQMVTHIEETIAVSEVQTKEQNLEFVEGPPPPRRNVAQERLSIFVEGRLDVRSKSSHAHRSETFPVLVEPGLSDSPNSLTQTRPRNKFGKRDGNERSHSAPAPSTPRANSKKRFTFPSVGRDPDEPEKLSPYQVRRPRKSAFWGLKRVRTVVNVLRIIFRLKRSRTAGHSPT